MEAPKIQPAELNTCSELQAIGGVPQEDPDNMEELLELTGGASFAVERVRLLHNNVVIQGSFEVSPLWCLSTDDQAFVTAFVESHGSIKEMERRFHVSYPTVKKRLVRISERLACGRIPEGDAHGLDRSP